MEYSPLHSLCESITDCPHSTPEWTTSGKIVIRNQNIKYGKLDLSNPSFTTTHDFQRRITRAKPASGDIIITREAPMGEACLVPKGLECCLGQRMVLLKPDNKKCNNKYLLYAILSRYVQHQISWSSGTGTTVSNLRIPHLENLSIPCPDRCIQDSIAGTLSSLDDKIELNNRIITNLEAQAQAIFKSWFVDFEPFQDGEFEENELGMIPKGWRVGRLGDAVEIQNRTFKPNSGSIKVEHYSIPAYDELKFPIFEEASYIKSNKFYVNTDCFMISKLNPETKRIWRPLCLTSQSVCSTEFIVYKAKKSKQKLFYYSLIDGIEFFNFLTSHVTGSTGSRQRATPKDTLEFRYALPSNELVDDFVALVTPVYKEIDALSIEIVKLKSTRDTLLPKLMSGEIEI